MLERSKNGCNTNNLDDVTKSIKSSVTKLKKSASKDVKLNSLVDIMELIKVAMLVSEISDEEFFEHMKKRREEYGVFVPNAK